MVEDLMTQLSFELNGYSGPKEERSNKWAIWMLAKKELCEAQQVERDTYAAACQAEMRNRGDRRLGEQ